ncbi:MAG: alpha/beta hydrolase [Haliscomenobacter sp.]|nr:alpha/beta hydrolase [Haliscomenobacter sp.]MBK9490364.1 alpha/beta hydrolase [Haliscomenobacter sp.]
MLRHYIYPLFYRKRFYASVVLFGFLAYTYDLVEVRLTDDTMIRKLEENAFAYVPKVTHFRQWGREMRYVQLGDLNKPLILFIHGAPASSSFWMGMLSDSTLLAHAKLMAVDRPGYGYSGYGQPEISVKKQAALIAGILKEKRLIHQKIIIHGSSYGGTVAARLAMDYPELVDGLLLQSASLKPGAETTYWISYPTHHWSLRNFIPGSFRTANAEKLSHKAQLQKMVPLWSRIRSKVIVLQGKDDTLIFPENATFAIQKLTKAASASLTLVPGSKHDLLWTQRALLVRSLLKLTD